MYIKLYNVNSDTQDTFTLSHRKVNWVIQIRINFENILSYL